MKTVHKYVLADVYNDVWTHEGARVLHVGNQREEICVWLEVDTESPKCVQGFTVVGTGQPVPPGARHAGSVIMQGGEFVFHVYA